MYIIGLCYMFSCKTISGALASIYVFSCKTHIWGVGIDICVFM
ncbi:hypothetical protein F383_05645 [Gossypium arboreum]|uniref:Uncharacterized protein n=1 Tax=Gossypium arboreum TaxID=29729 RepID=A0A0B0PNJ9_GOSAR|nr:hypothetical protein F383_05645 [Gossypium arboreum]